MSYKLVIAEKPSMAQSIAKVIGADKREDGYLEGNGYIVSWCVGHLVELASPESYDEKYEKWRYDDLPILPSQWNYQIAAATRKQFNILKKLMERENVTGLVEVTDADLPSGVQSGKMQKAIRALMDFFNGRPGDFGWLF